MSIEERIAEIVTTHRRSDYWGGPDWDCGAPDCRASGNDHDDYAAHVASVLVAELGLQPRWSWESAEECRPDGFGSPEEALAEGHDKPTHCRYVTPWELS